MTDTEHGGLDAVSHYTYRVAWSPEDAEFVATVLEFPSLSWLDPSQLDALHGLQVLVAAVVADLQRDGEAAPKPFSERAYSGKFNVRLGERLHREVAIRAAQEDLSLNQYVVRQLASER